MEESDDCSFKLSSSTCWYVPAPDDSAEPERGSPVLIVAGLKDFHTMVSQILVAMKREMPEPSP